MTSRTTLGLIGIVPLTLDIKNHTFIQNFIICKKLKQPFLVGLDSAQNTKIGVDLDTYGTLFLRYESTKIAAAMKKVIHADITLALFEKSAAEKLARDE